MKITHLLYPFVILIFSLFFQLVSLNGGYRLPIYYLPDGEIIPMANTHYFKSVDQIKSINGQNPFSFPAVFSNSEPVLIYTVQGGLLWLTPVPNSIKKILSDFKYFIILSVFFLLCFVWFWSNTRDLHLSFITLIIGLLLFFFITMASYHKFTFLAQISALMVPAAFVNIGFRTTGRSVPFYVTVAEVIFILFLSLVAYVGKNNIATLQNLAFLVIIVFFLTTIFVMCLHIQRVLRKTGDSVEHRKRWFLFLGIFMGIFIPFLLSLHTFYYDALAPFFNYFVMMILFFPISLIYGTYRLQIVPFHLVASKSLVVFLVSISFIFAYAIVLLTHNLLLPYQEEHFRWIIHIIFILILILFLDPLQRIFSQWVENSIFRFGEKLSNSLRRTTLAVSSNRRVLSGAAILLQEVEQNLVLEKATLLLSESAFPDFRIQGKIIRLPDQSPLWEYIQQDQLVVSSYLTYGTGARGELFRFFLQNQYILSLGIIGLKESFFASLKKKIFPNQSHSQVENIKMALLIGKRKGKKSFKIKDILYLQAGARLVRMMTQNYIVLLEEIEKRRKIRELHLAGKIQRSLPETKPSHVRGIQLAYSGKPALLVTGDYFDLLQAGKNQITGFIGDVSGHGLGTGYLVSSIRAIIHSHLQNGANLRNTINILNEFFLERYKGNEFMTLFAFCLNTSNGDMEYFNAAHPCPFLIRTKKREVVKLEGIQRMLGVLANPYRSYKTVISRHERIFLYSDGVVETFDRNDIPFSEERLEIFLNENKDLSLHETIEKLNQQLVSFRGKSGQLDDVTMAVLEFSPTQNVLQNIISKLTPTQLV